MRPVKALLVYRTLLCLWTGAYLLARVPHIAELYCRPVLRQDVLHALGAGPPPVWLVQVLFALCLVGLVGVASGRRARAWWVLVITTFSAIQAMDLLMMRAYGQLAWIQWALLWFAPFDRAWNDRAYDHGTTLLKLQVCSVWLLAVPAKLAGVGWWDGSALVAALGNPAFGDFGLAAGGIPAAAGLVLAWATMSMEGFIPVGLWFRRTLPVAIGLSLLLHGAMLFTLRISPLFHLLMWAHLVLFATVPPARRTLGETGGEP